MKLDKYIKALLYRYECVIVPEFGAFLTQRRGAQVHHTTNAFYPPSKELSFNAQLSSNDGLLVKHIADVTGKEYEVVLNKVQKKVATWKQDLANKEIVSLENIGDFWLNVEGNIQFEPSYHLNYLTSSFGLSSFVSAEINRVVEEVSEKVTPVIVEEKTPEIPVVIPKEEHKRFRFPWRYVAAAVLIFGASFFGFREYQSQQQLVEQGKAQESINEYIQQATFFGNNPVELPSITLQVAKEVQNYHIVAGAFRIEENAHTKIAQLRSKGFDAALLGKNKYGLHQVSYASFATREEANEALAKIKQTEAPGAWLLVTE